MEQLSLDQMLAAIPPQLLDQKIAKDIHLAELARSLTNWRAAISYLGLRDTDEEAIEEENSRLDAQRRAVLRKWRQKYGPTATYRNLAKCFYNADKPEMVEAVCKVLQPNAPPPQPAAQHQPATGYYPPPGAYQQPPPPGAYQQPPPPGAYQQPPPPGAYQQPPPPGQQYYTTPYQPTPTAQFVGQTQGMLKPTEKQLMIELRNTVASEWQSIGTFLEIPSGELSIIDDRHRGDPQKCLMAMLAVWLPRTNPPPCWPDIADAVDFVGRPDVAQKIRQKYCVPGMQPQQSQGMYSHQQIPQLSGQAPHLVQPRVQWQAPSGNYGFPQQTMPSANYGILQQNTSQFYPQQAAMMQPVQSGGSHGYPQQQSGMILAGQDLHILTEILRPAVPQWRQIGGALGILEYDLDIIQHSPMLIPVGPPGYLREALTQWLKWAPPNHPWPTIEALAHAVQSIGQEGLAFNLKSLFLQKKGAQPQPTGPVYNQPQAQPMYTQQLPQLSGHAPQMQPPVQVQPAGSGYQRQQPTVSDFFPSQDKQTVVPDGGPDKKPFDRYEAYPRGNIAEMKLSFGTVIPDTNIKQSADRGEERYEMRATPHGLAVIINNEEFDKLSAREGTDIDEKNLIQTFRYLGYTVEVHCEKTSEQILGIFEDIRKRDHSNHDSFVCCILSHGKGKGIYGCDDVLVEIEAISSKLNGKACQTLAGKPKMCFFQACRGKAKDPIVTDSDESEGDSFFNPIVTDSGESVPIEGDFFFGYATPLNYVAFRSELAGSWYVLELCRILCTYGASVPLMDIHKRVKGEVNKRYQYGSKKQISEDRSRLRKAVYFM